MKSRNSLAIATLGVILLGTGCSGDDSSATTVSTTDAPVAQTTITAPSEAPTTAAFSPTAVVVDYYSALNASDLDIAKALWPTLDEAMFLVLVNGVHQRVSASCSLGTEAGTAICEEEVARNDFTGPAGLLGTYSVVYHVDGAGIITEAEILDQPDGVGNYVSAFGEWLADANPDLFASGFQREGLFPFPTPEDAEAIIALVDDFLSDSEAYPLNKG